MRSRRRAAAYKFGAKLKSVVETAREQMAELIGAHARDVIFTSCATESNNAAIAAALKANPGKRHIVTSQVEHSSVLNYCMALSSGDFTSHVVSAVHTLVQLQNKNDEVKSPLQEQGI